MTTLVIDASIVIKWVVEEAGTSAAIALRNGARLIAPELLVAECADILWKKVGRRELSIEEALLAARLLQGAEVELLPTRPLLEAATRIAIDTDHPAYDCRYFALAVANDCRFVTADERFLHRLADRCGDRFRDRAISLTRAAAAPQAPPPTGRAPR